MNTSKIELLEKSIEGLEILTEQKQNELKEIEFFIDNFEPDLHDHYDEMLDDTYQEEIDQVSFISLPCPSELLKEHDPVAYRCGYNDYLDSFDFNELEEYQDLLQQKEEIENEISELEDQIEEVQEEIETLEEEEE